MIYWYVLYCTNAIAKLDVYNINNCANIATACTHVCHTNGDAYCEVSHLQRLSIPAILKQSDTIFDIGNSTVSVNTTDKLNDNTIVYTQNMIYTVSVNIKLD